MILGIFGMFFDMVWLLDLYFMDLFFKFKGFGLKFFNFMFVIVSMDICLSKIVFFFINRLLKKKIELIVYVVV